MRIAFLGLGRMGSGMAGRLLDAGHQVSVFNRSPHRADPLVARGATAAATPREAAEGAEAVVAMVADDAASRSVWFGPDGALAAEVADTPAGALAIECSTLSRGWVLELAAGPAPAEQVAVAFVTHSIPIVMDAASGPPGVEHAYTRQHRAVAAAAMEALAGPGEAGGRRPAWDLVFCSRSGPPQQPWLEPDIGEHLAALAAAGVRAVVLVPLGFVSDHMEVVNDLDTVAMAQAAELGLRAVRVPTMGRHPGFAGLLTDLVLDAAASARGAGPAAAGTPGGARDALAELMLGCCGEGCCPAPRRPEPAR